MRLPSPFETFRYSLGDSRAGHWLKRLLAPGPHANKGWRRHVDLGSGTTGFGLSQAAWKDYRVPSADGALKPAYSMMELGELALLYGLARDRWTGRGEVVDLGPYTGLTTWCLAKGIADNSGVGDRCKRLHSYDLFLNADGSGESILPQYLELNAPFLDDVAVRPGDILQAQWSGAPIEILFIDLAKSEALQDHVVQQFLNRLTPGAIVVQQDYVHYFHHWIHLLMEVFADHFALEELVYGASAVYRLVRPLPDLSDWTLAQAVPVGERAALHRRHIARAPAVARGALWCAHAKLLIDMGDRDGAQAALEQVRLVPERDPLHDFRPIVPSNREAIETLLAG